MSLGLVAILCNERKRNDQEESMSQRTFTWVIVGIVLLFIVYNKSYRARTVVTLKSSRVSSWKASVQRPIFLVWTKNTTEFGRLQRASLESLLLMHSASAVTIFSDTLPKFEMLTYKHMGYNISVLTLSECAELVPKAREVVKRIQSSGNKNSARVQPLIDLLRLYLVQQYGAFVVDFDTIWVNSMLHLEPTLVLDDSDNTSVDAQLLIGFTSYSPFIKEAIRILEKKLAEK